MSYYIWYTRGHGGWMGGHPMQSPHHYTKYNNTSIHGRCTNLILSDSVCPLHVRYVLGIQVSRQICLNIVTIHLRMGSIIIPTAPNRVDQMKMHCSLQQMTLSIFTACCSVSWSASITATSECLGFVQRETQILLTQVK